MNNKYSGYIVPGILGAISLTFFTAALYPDIRDAIKDINNYRSPTNVQPTSQPSESQRKIKPSRLETAELYLDKQEQRS